MFKFFTALTIAQSLYALTMDYLALAQTIKRLVLFSLIFEIFSAPGGEKITPEIGGGSRRGLSLFGHGCNRSRRSPNREFRGSSS